LIDTALRVGKIDGAHDIICLLEEVTNGMVVATYLLASDVWVALIRSLKNESVPIWDEIMRVRPLMLTHKWRDSVTHLSRHESELDLERIVFLHK
jgi:hypothetical protein